MARSTVILAVIAGALLAFIVLHERNLMSSGELSQRKNRVLTTFVKDRIHRIEVMRGGNTMVLERTADADGVFSPWKMTAPMDVAADAEAVEVLLGELEWLQPRRTLTDVGRDDQARFGFDKPVIEVRYAMGKQRVRLLVGGEDPTGAGIYARTDDASVAYVVGKNLVEGLDHDPGHYHTKELHRGVFMFSASAVLTRDAIGEGRAEYKDGAWTTQTPTLSLVSTVEVEQAVKALDQLRAKRFIALRQEGPVSYGLEAPTFLLTVERTRDAKTDDDLTTPVTLTVGAPCTGHEGERYVQVNGGAIMCASDDDLAKVTRPVRDLIDHTALPLDPERLSEIRVEADGRVMVLARTEERWALTVTRGSKVEQDVAADRDAVMDWLRALRAAQWSDSVDAASSPGGSVLSVIQMKTIGSGPAFVLQAKTLPDGAVLVQRGPEPSWRSFDAAASQVLQPFAARFRSLLLVDGADAQLTALTVSHGDREEAAELVDGRWAIRKPVVADADPVVMSEVSHLLTRLSAVRFVADGPAPEHGLGPTQVGAARPTMGVTFKLGAQEYSVSFGASTTDGVFAQLDKDAAVFVLPTRVVETLSLGLLAKTALSTPLEQIRGVQVRAGRSADGIGVRFQDGRFVRSEGTPESLNPTQLVERIARLRAERVVHYGPAQASEGLASPTLRVTVDAGDPVVTHELTFGASVPGASPPAVFARRSDIDATLTVTSDAADRLRELTQ